MILTGGARKSGRFFAAHLMKVKGNERVSIVEMKNLWAEDVPEAFREMKSMAKATRAENYFYHLSINTNPKEANLTPEQWEQATDLAEQKLGLTDHARFVVEHEKNGRTHRHIVWSRVDADTMTVTPAKNDYYIHMQTGRELEMLFNHQPTLDITHGHRAEKEFADWELFRAQEGRDPKEVKAEVTALYKASDSGVAFKSALEDAGYVLCNGQRGYCLIDEYADSHSLVRRIDGMKTAALRDFMAEIPLESLPSVAEASAAVRGSSEAESESGGMVIGILSEEQAAQSLNPKLAVLDKYAHDHPALAPPETYPVADSAQALCDTTRAAMTFEPTHDRYAWDTLQAWRDSLPEAEQEIKEETHDELWQEWLTKDREQQKDEPELER